jgi:hypothetical protein
MTLPFRRRHHDTESSHDRARALTSDQLVGELDADDAEWLTSHTEACTECRREREAFASDRELLRSLRDKPIDPPRDLWARTAAALDREAGKRQAIGTGADGLSVSGRGAGVLGPLRGVPMGAAAGLAILVVVLGTALLPGLVPSQTQPPVAVASQTPGPTPISVAAKSIPWLRSGANGSWDLVVTDIEKVCPRSRPDCIPAPEGNAGSSVGLLGARPSTATISPRNDQLVFAGDTAGAGKIYVVPVPTGGAGQTPTPTFPTDTASALPGTSPPVSPEPVATPFGQIEIASGVTIVGEVAYSADGQWLAFSAAPVDGSAGPDLYVWSAGSGTATPVTNDHQTYFSAWLGGQILASHVAAPETPVQPGAPRPSKGPAASADNGNGQGPPIDAHPTSFLLDPATHTRTEIARQDVWLPVVDPTSRFVAYWSGALRSTDGVTWELGAGQLVLDAWSPGPAGPEASGAAPASSQPGASAAPAVGPSGRPASLVTGQVADFRVKFDPEGIRLAVWVGEHRGESVGRLRLAVIDPATGSITAADPLPGTPALRRFSIDVNRLAWVSPPGQDGQESSLQVLGWTGDAFGEIQTEPAQNLLILR